MQAAVMKQIDIGFSHLALQILTDTRSWWPVLCFRVPMLDFDELEEIETQRRIAPDASCDEAFYLEKVSWSSGCEVSDGCRLQVGLNN